MIVKRSFWRRTGHGTVRRRWQGPQTSGEGPNVSSIDTRTAQLCAAPLLDSASLFAAKSEDFASSSCCAAGHFRGPLRVQSCTPSSHRLLQQTANMISYPSFFFLHAFRMQKAGSPSSAAAAHKRLTMRQRALFLFANNCNWRQEKFHVPGSLCQRKRVTGCCEPVVRVSLSRVRPELVNADSASRTFNHAVEVGE